jgi:hypothetical protein
MCPSSKKTPLLLLLLLLHHHHHHHHLLLHTHTNGIANSRERRAVNGPSEFLILELLSALPNANEHLLCQFI